MKMSIGFAAGIAAAAMFAAGSAQAKCVNKGANATAGDEAAAKWFVMETMVQSVSWGLWPGFLSANPQHTKNYKVAGYKISREVYTCKPQGGQVFCRGRATFCKS